MIAARRKPGRPPLPPDERRSASLVVDLREQDYDAMKARAERAGKTLAGWARDVLVRAAKR